MFTPKAFGKQDPKFSASFLINKSDKAQVKLIEAAIEKVALAKFGGKIPKKLKTPLFDGDEKEDVDGYGDEIVYVNAKSGANKRPQVVNRDRSALVEEDGVIYAGCVVNAMVDLYAYDHPVGGKGVAAGLQAIQFVKDAPSFGADPVNVDSAFEDLTEEESDIL